MEQLKPIEPGCLAVVIKSVCGNTGKVVGVVEYVGAMRDMPTDDGRVITTNQALPNIWRIDRSVNREAVRHDDSIAAFTAPYISGESLMRIDGDWEGKETETEETLKEKG